MDKKVKVLAAYLPQYHEIPENNKWWGEGYTDWVAVRNAKSQIEGQKQPRVPLGENYYDLDKIENIKWQSELAKKYGVYGFAIYHYWFSSNQKLLTIPAELILQHTEIETKYFFVWDNNSWVNKTWKNVKFTNQWAPQFEEKGRNDEGILAELKYGDESEWRKHYEYLRLFFLDNRYIKHEGCPLFGIFQPTNNHELLLKMCSYWNILAKNDGFPGIKFLSAATFSRKRIDLEFRYEPFNVCTPMDYFKRKRKLKQELKIYDYDKVWKKILFNARFARNKKTILGGFVRYDDTPRRGDKANIIVGDTPSKFEYYMSKLIEISKKQNKEYIYLTAWNEWGEGAYLEPDTITGYEYLESLKKAIDNNDKKISI